MSLHRRVMCAIGLMMVTSPTIRAAPPSPALPPQPLAALPADTLSDQETRAGRIAEQNGDRTFLMVDKRLGKIILFEGGKPVYAGAALTGESTDDRLPPRSLAMHSNKMTALKYKITPAGRFTLSRDFDHEYGVSFNIDQLIGHDWEDAIHRVYLGTPSEHRAERLASPNEAAKHISFGCINVAPETIALLSRELPKHGHPVLYVLPQDETKTDEFFTRRGS